MSDEICPVCSNWAGSLGDFGRFGHHRTCPLFPAVAVGQIDRLEGAIRRHRDYRGDDRCVGDNHELYSVLPEGDTRPRHETLVTIENCKRFIACQEEPGREYVSPEREIERLREALTWAVYYLRCNKPKIAEYPDYRNALSLVEQRPIHTGEFTLMRYRAELAEDDVLRLRKIIDGMAARIVGQSELLSRRAESPDKIQTVPEETPG